MGSMNFAVMTLAIDFWQLPKVMYDRKITLYKQKFRHNTTFGNCQKSTAKVSTANFLFPDKMSREI
jgi:hypothetical protein